MEYKQSEVYDLRSALELLKKIPGQYEETEICLGITYEAVLQALHHVNIKCFNIREIEL